MTRGRLRGGQKLKNPFRRDYRPLFAMIMIFCRLRCDDVRADEFEFRAIWNLIHHFGMVTQKAVKKSETSAYAMQNLAYFQRKWGRTVRGNWLQRRVDGLRGRWVERMEKIRYGHTLVECG